MPNKITPTPWRCIHGLEIVDSEGTLIGSVSESTFIEMDNAAFIVRACNSHDDLVEALTELLADAKRVESAVCSYEEGHNIYTGTQAVIDKANAALAKAKGEA